MAIGQFMPMFAGGAIEPDPYWSSVKALWYFNGSGGAIIFPDSSPNNIVLTRAGDAQISTAQSKFGGGSLYLDGTGDYLFNTTAMGYGAGSYIIEFWVHPLSIKEWVGVIDMRSASGNWSFCIPMATGGRIAAHMDGNIRFQSDPLPLNLWTHVALVRNAAAYSFFINGLRVAGSFSSSTVIDPSITIGSYVDTKNTSASGKFHGYIDDLRLTYGVARYTSNFTPPAKQFADF